MSKAETMAEIRKYLKDVRDYGNGSKVHAVAIAYLLKEHDTLEADKALMREALEAVEWEYYLYARAYVCAWDCGAIEGQDHAPDCQRQKALGLSKREKSHKGSK